MKRRPHSDGVSQLARTPIGLQGELPESPPNLALRLHRLLLHRSAPLYVVCCEHACLRQVSLGSGSLKTIFARKASQ